MTSRDDSSPKAAPANKADARAERERRLAEALRANLKRRKKQSRGRTEDTGEPPPRGDADK